MQVKNPRASLGRRRAWFGVVIVLLFGGILGGALPVSAASSKSARSGVACAEDADKQKYLAAQRTDSSDAYRDYLADFPHGCFAEDAGRILTARKDDEDWAKARNVDTLGSYQTYVDAHAPGGKYIETALAEIQRLSAKPADNRTYSIFDQVRIFGPSVGEATSLTYADCEARCRQGAACVGFTFDRLSRICSLFSGINEARRDANAQSGSTVSLNIGEARTQPSPEPDFGGAAESPTFSYLNAADLPGNDIEEYRDISVTGCEYRCQGNPTCAAFTYNIPNNVCFLKSYAAAPEGNEDAYSGVRTRR